MEILKSDLRKLIRETIREFIAIKGGEGKFWVSHSGAEPHKKYLMRNGQLGPGNKAQTFTSLAKAEAASKKTGLNTHVINHRGEIMEATKGPGTSRRVKEYQVHNLSTNPSLMRKIHLSLKSLQGGKFISKSNAGSIRFKVSDGAIRAIADLIDKYDKDKNTYIQDMGNNENVYDIGPNGIDKLPKRAMNEQELRELVRGEVSAVTAEGYADSEFGAGVINSIRDDFWIWEGGWSKWITESENRFKDDKVFKKLNGEVRKLLGAVEQHLDAEYRDWD